MSRRGMSLIELMVVMGVMITITLGISGLMAGLYGQLKQANLQQTLEGLKISFQTAVLSGSAWNFTVGDGVTVPINSNLDCVRENTLCATGITLPIFLKDGGNSVIFDPLPGTNGYTRDGSPCATFDAVGGNPDCPISYDIKWEAVCPGAAVSCLNPTVKVFVELLWSPGPNYTYVAVNPARFNLALVRGEGTKNIPVVLAEVLTDPGNHANGPCDTSWTYNTRRQINTEVEDPADLATLMGAGRFRLKTGSYTCQIYVPGFAVGGFNARLRNVTDGTTYATSGAVASQWIQSTAVITANFQIPTGKVFRVEQQCQDTNLIPPVTGVSMDLGIFTQPYGNTTFTYVSCVRIN